MSDNGTTNENSEEKVETGKGLYLEALQLIERLHRQFLDVVKAELDREDIKDCNNVQALILYNIGEDEMTVGELTTRGYYLGSNVTYNLKKLVENGDLGFKSDKGFMKWSKKEQQELQKKLINHLLKSVSNED